jgi:hypothetical protein
MNPKRKLESRARSGEDVEPAFSTAGCPLPRAYADPTGLRRDPGHPHLDTNANTLAIQHRKLGNEGVTELLPPKIKCPSKNAINYFANKG